MLPLLEERFDVLAPDLPGFGHSPPLPEGEVSNPERLADAVEEAMDEAGFETAHISGNSLGGWIALVLARRGRARTCVPISPAGLLHARETGYARAVLNGMRWMTKNAPPPEPLLRNPVTRTLCAGPPVARPWRADPDAMIEEFDLFANAPGFDRTLDATVELQVAGLHDIKCPVLVLWGTRDLILIPRQGRRFKRLIPNCELRYLKGLGHVPMSDDPELLASAITDFALATPSPAPRAAVPA
jgi:pimeloyl-ACP methyl ester carboxylesterase